MIASLFPLCHREWGMALHHSRMLGWMFRLYRWGTQKHLAVLAKPPSQEAKYWTSLAVQWLRLSASNAEGTGLIPDQGTKIPHSAWLK